MYLYGDLKKNYTCTQHTGEREREGGGLKSTEQGWGGGGGRNKWLERQRGVGKRGLREGIEVGTSGRGGRW